MYALRRRSNPLEALSTHCHGFTDEAWAGSARTAVRKKLSWQRRARQVRTLKFVTGDDLELAVKYRVTENEPVGYQIGEKIGNMTKELNKKEETEGKVGR